VQFRLLGQVEVEAAGRVVPLPRRRVRALLAVLLLNLNRVVSMDWLAELLWDGDPPERVRRTLYGHVSRLRAALAATGDVNRGVVATIGDSYRIEVDPQAVDAHRFQALLVQAAETADPVLRIDRLRTALDLWRGPALGNAASDWLRHRLCAGLEERRLTAIEDLVAASLALRREREVLPDLAQAAHAHPGRETLIALQIRALYQAGRKNDALDVYLRAGAYTAGELGLDPSPGLRELHLAVLRDELPVPAAPDVTARRITVAAAPVTGPCAARPAGPPAMPLPAAAEPVAARQPIPDRDLEVVGVVVPDPGMAVVTEPMRSTVVNRAATMPLVAGSLRSPGQVGLAAWPSPGTSVIAVPVAEGRPHSGMSTGSGGSVLVPAGEAAEPGGEAPPTVTAVTAVTAVIAVIAAVLPSTTAGVSTVSLLLDATHARQIAAGGKVVLVLESPAATERGGR
jgi:DNA-binding SARP family transcriptional activator